MENDFIKWMKETEPAHDFVELGIGDDAAILKTGNRTVVAKDVLADGVHFESQKTEPELIGRKSIAVNLSDIAAMAAKPVAAFIGIFVPRSSNEQFIHGIYTGIRKICKEYEVAIAGGDTNVWNHPLVISVTLIGAKNRHGIWTRSGGKIGDKILVTGTLGGSILGHHLKFEPLVREAIAIQSEFKVHACIDISDGLVLDLSRLINSSDCGAELDLSTIPVSQDAMNLAENDSEKALRHALSDGEDFQLLMTINSNEADKLLQRQLGIKITQIGELVKGTGVWNCTANGNRTLIDPAGYEHTFED